MNLDTQADVHIASLDGGPLHGDRVRSSELTTWIRANSGAYVRVARDRFTFRVIESFDSNDKTRVYLNGQQAA